MCPIERVPPDLSVPVDCASAEEVDVGPREEPEGRAV